LDSDGNVILEFRGDSGVGHQANFVEAVIKRSPELLTADVQTGHDSTGWCNLANICFQSGSHDRLMEAVEAAGGFGGWNQLIESMHTHLQAHRIGPDTPSMKMSTWMEMDPTTGRFVGEGSNRANAFLRRSYRAPFEVPEIV
jgi:hypothetical protein